MALQMVEQGDVHYLCFDTLAERTLAFAQQRRVQDPATGYDPLLRRRVGGVLEPALRKGTRIAGNMGSANPVAAGRVLLEEATARGIADLSVAVVTGDDILDRVRDRDVSISLWDADLDLASLLERLVSANVYLGFAPTLLALAEGADVVVTGRAADVAPYMAAIVHHHGWDPDDLDGLARAAVIGHLLECGRWITGGGYAEPAYGRETPDPHDLSLPLAEVDADGIAVITKVDGTGGIVSTATCSQQLIHEINDPARYLTPDVTVDMRGVTFTEVAPNRVRVEGARGAPPPATLKVLLGVDQGWVADAEVSFAGPGAVAKAEQATLLLRDRLPRAGVEPDELRCDLIGVNSVLGPATPHVVEPFEVRARIACRLPDRDAVQLFLEESQDLWNVPGIGAGGVRTSSRPLLAMVPASMPQEHAAPRVDVTRQRLGVGGARA